MVARCWLVEFGLGFVEGNVGDVFLRGGEIDEGLCRRMVAPGAYGVEISDERRRETCGEDFACEFVGEAVGEVLEHGDRDEDGVARRPWGGGEVEQTELEWEMVS